MIRRPPRSTLDRSSAASDVYKRQVFAHVHENEVAALEAGKQILAKHGGRLVTLMHSSDGTKNRNVTFTHAKTTYQFCLLYTSDAADERSSVDLGGRRILKKTKQHNLGATRIHQKQ